MTTLTLKQAKNDLEGLVARVVADCEPALIRDKAGAEVVVLSADDFNSWQETVYLLSNPANAAHLQRSLDQAKTGKVRERQLVEP